MEIARIHLDHWLEYAAVRGVKPDEFQANFPLIITGEKDNNEAATIPASRFNDVLQFIFNTLSDDLIGIKAGQFLTLKLLGLIYQISLQTRTIEEALHYLSSYLDSTFPIVRFV